MLRISTGRASTSSSSTTKRTTSTPSASRSGRSFTLHYALGGQAALDELERIDPAVIVSDQRMPGMSGIEFLKRAKERRPDTVGILLTAYADLAVLIDAVNSGAVDRYVQKPWDSKELTVILRQAISSFATVRENRRLREQLAHYAGYLEREQRDPIDFGEIAGEAAGDEGGRPRASPMGAPTVVAGAHRGRSTAPRKRSWRAPIHVGSPREERPFVKVTCAAFRGDALERELFGWQRGAFDGAFDDRAGRFELAHGGTHLPRRAARPLARRSRRRLLRALERGEVERVGATEPIAVDVRVVVSLSPGLEEACAGRRAPARARLAALGVSDPPARRCASARATCACSPSISCASTRGGTRARRRRSRPRRVAKLEAYAWPGNVRELENVIERAAILSRGDVIHARAPGLRRRDRLRAPHADRARRAVADPG